MSSETETPLFKGKFIPDQPGRFRLRSRVPIGIGLGALAAVLSLVCSDVLAQLGDWVTPVLVSILTVAGTVVWILDERRPTPADLDGETP